MKVHLDFYHSWPNNTREHLVPRIQALQNIILANEQLVVTPGIHRDHFKFFQKHVEARYNYLSKLYNYLTTKREKINELLRVFAEHYEHGTAFGNIVREKGGSLYLSVHWKRIFEKIDPLHRTETVRKAYLVWLSRQVDTGNDPAENLVDFFLQMDHMGMQHDKGTIFYELQHPMQTPHYHSPFHARFNRVHFQNQRAKTFYAILEPGQHVYAKYDFTVHHALVCRLKRLNTTPIKGRNRYPKNPMGRGSRAEPDLAYSYIYIMRDDKLYVYAQGSGIFHTVGQSGKAVQAAGMLVAEDGKILAIDNKSGHYRPDWRLLFQAVKLIWANDGFLMDAFAGVGYDTESEIGTGSSYGCMYFPVDVFIYLANQSFPLGATYEQLRLLSRLYPGGPRDYPAAAFCGEPFFRIYQAVWSGWETEIKCFLEYLYPEGRSIFDGLDYVVNNQTVWTEDEFVRNSKETLRSRRNVSHIDPVLREYHAFREELVRRIQAPGRNLDDIINRMWQLRERCMLLGFEAQQTWARIKDTGRRKHLDALETLAAQAAAEVGALPDKSEMAKTGRYKAA